MTGTSAGEIDSEVGLPMRGPTTPGRVRRSRGRCVTRARGAPIQGSVPRGRRTPDPAAARAFTVQSPSVARPTGARVVVMPRRAYGDPVSVLLISGSTRSGSTNTAVVRTVAALAPDRTQVWTGLADLPAF